MHSEDDDSIRPEQLPIFQKGKEIYYLTTQIVALIPEEDEMLMSFKQFMLEDAAQLSVKVAGAEGADLYDLRMEAAALIRKAGRDMLAHCSGLELFGFEETHYLHLIREAIEEYRLLFVEWVSGFDPWNYTVDRWGLFNPPGVQYDDPDPDDELPE
jgi:hypothetical protein